MITVEPEHTGQHCESGNLGVRPGNLVEWNLIGVWEWQWG